MDSLLFVIVILDLKLCLGPLDELALPMAPRNRGCSDYHYWVSGDSGSPRRGNVSV